MNPYEKLGRPLNTAAMEQAKNKWNAVAKPLYGLGKLEDMITRIAGIQGNANIQIEKRRMLVFCSDNGIVEEGVTQADSLITALVAGNIAEGKASINQMCQKCNTDVTAIDIGMKKHAASNHILNRRVAAGTKNFLLEPAMTYEEADQAIQTGIALVKKYKEQGYGLIGTGEMGIGNTTTASAVAISLLNLEPDRTIGRGAGLSDEGLRRKHQVINKALQQYDLKNCDAFDVLCKVGGFDIAGMTGAFIGGAIYGIPILMDGMISAAAALIAARLCPLSREYMIATHISREPAMEAIIKELSLSPVIDGRLALGEGTGAALLIPMLDMANAVYNTNETFQELQMTAYETFEEK